MQSLEIHSTSIGHTSTAFPFSGTITFVDEPFIAEWPYQVIRMFTSQG
jgi:hypothetical protein